MNDEPPSADELRLMRLDMRATRVGRYLPKVERPAKRKSLPSAMLDIADAEVKPCQRCKTGSLVYANHPCGYCLRATLLTASEAQRFEAALDREPRVIPELATLLAGGRENG